MKFATNLSLGVLGQPDSEELWSEIINKIEIKPNMKFLNVASGHGTEAKLLARKLVASGYYNKQEALDAIFLLDKYNVFCNQAKLMGFKNIIEADFLEYEFNMKFDVVIGNPPYQSPGDGNRNIGAPLWPLFIKKSFEVVKDNGQVAMVTPATWLNRSLRGAWGTLKDTNIRFLEPNAKKYFPTVGGNGGTFSYFVSEKTEYSGKTELPSGITLDLCNDTLPANNTMFTEDNLEFLNKTLNKVIPLDVKSGPNDPSINSNHWSNTKTSTHIYETYYSGKSNRRSIWCDQPVGDHGEWKLVVASSGNIYNTLEITRKGVGRQGNYVTGTKKQLEELKDLLLSDTSVRLNELMLEGNYNNALKYIVNE